MKGFPSAGTLPPWSSQGSLVSLALAGNSLHGVRLSNLNLLALAVKLASMESDLRRIPLEYCTNVWNMAHIEHCGLLHSEVMCRDSPNAVGRSCNAVRSKSLRQ